MSTPGAEVAVKVQYPGVAAALRSDLRAVSAVTRLAAVLAPGAALPPLVAELRERLCEELDYGREARVQRAFAQAYRGDPDVAVPEVVAVGRPGAGDALAATACRWPRWPLGHARPSGTGPGRCTSASCSPVRSAPAGCTPTPTRGTSGCCRRTARGAGLRVGAGPARRPAADASARLIRLLQAGDPQAVLAGLRAEGMVVGEADVDVAALMGYLAPFTDPAGHEQFSFSPEWLRAQMGRLHDPRNPDFAVALRLRLPAEHLFTHRVWLGIVGVLCGLRATVPNRSELERWLPGFVAEQACD